MDLSISQHAEYAGDDYWKWSVWIDGPARELDQIESVTYTLHRTFPKPVRVVTSRENNFRLSTAGWGGFTIYAKVLRKDGSTESLKHTLTLYYPHGTSTGHK